MSQNCHSPRNKAYPSQTRPLFLSFQAGEHDCICKGFSYSHHRTEFIPPFSEISNYVDIQLGKHISYKFQSTVNPHHVKDALNPVWDRFACGLILRVKVRMELGSEAILTS